MYEVDEYTVSLLHFDDGIKDETGKVWTAQNGATVSTTKSKSGGASLYLNGADQYLTTPNNADFDFGDEDFTIDWWEYSLTRPRGSAVFATTTYISIPETERSLAVGWSDGNTIQCYLSSNGTSWDIAKSLFMGTVILNTWTHYAVCRKEMKLYTFQNGVLQASVTIPNNNRIHYPTKNSVNMGQWGIPDNAPFSGYIDELRVSNIARWTSDFNPKPTNLIATAGDSKVTLSWTAVDGATGYNVKRSTTAGGSYTTIASNVSGTSYVDTSVTNGITYYYVVAALNTYGESANSNEVSATPEGIGLLRITMNDSSEREYQLTSSEADKFIAWCNRTVDTGTAYYVFDKVVGSQNSKEYLFFEKIISFEVFKL